MSYSKYKKVSKNKKNEEEYNKKEDPNDYFKELIKDEYVDSLSKELIISNLEIIENQNMNNSNQDSKTKNKYNTFENTPIQNINNKKLSNSEQQLLNDIMINGIDAYIYNKSENNHKNLIISELDDLQIEQDSILEHSNNNNVDIKKCKINNLMNLLNDFENKYNLSLNNNT